MFVEGQVWLGNPKENMQEVYDRIGPSIGKSSVRQAEERAKPSGEFTGTIAAPINQRGFGFISPADGEVDVLFHISDNPNAECMRRGAGVSYDLNRDVRRGRTSAVNVRLV